MNESLHKLLTNEGFRKYTNNRDEASTNRLVLCDYQKRIDDLFPDAPLCTTNDKLYINVEYTAIEVPDHLDDAPFAHRTHEGVEISLRHGNKDDIWFDLKAYAIQPSALTDKPELLDEMIEKLVGAWKIVNL